MAIHRHVRLVSEPSLSWHRPYTEGDRAICRATARETNGQVGSFRRARSRMTVGNELHPGWLEPDRATIYVIRTPERE
jgi:hypothetical protein